MSLIDDIKRDREAGIPQEWSAERTSCRDLPDTVWAILWDKTPGGRKNEDGSTSYSFRFPVLLGSDWLAEPEKGMKEISDMLNLAERAKAALLAAEDHLVAALKAISEGYAHPDISHEDFRVKAAQFADAALAAYREATK